MPATERRWRSRSPCWAARTCSATNSPRPASRSTSRWRAPEGRTGPRSGPWPEALRGDVDLASGATDVALERYEHAFALACQLGDTCWEGIAARGIGLAAAARDEIDEALKWLREARTRCGRLPDTWL